MLNPNFKAFLITIAIILGVFALGIGVNFLRIATLPVRNFENKVNLNKAVIDATWDPQRCMTEYDWFLQREQSLKARVVQLQNFTTLIADLKEDQTRKEDKKLDTMSIDEELKQTRSQATGLNNFYESEKAEYNAKSDNIIKVHCKDLTSKLYISPNFVF